MNYYLMFIKVFFLFIISSGVLNCVINCEDVETTEEVLIDVGYAKEEELKTLTSLEVTYEPDQVVNKSGRIYDKDKVGQTPATVEFNSDEGKLYTLMMVDPDARSRKEPEFRSIRHWLVVNITGNDVRTGSEITEYTGPHPPEGSGPHRYVFLAYEQSNPLSLGVDNDRAKFNVSDFAEKNNLGAPIAANYFLSEF